MHVCEGMAPALSVCAGQLVLHWGKASIVAFSSLEQERTLRARREQLLK
jgi:hypothetical protein